MDPINVFSSKAEVYDRYRWSYAPQAIETILAVSALSNQDTLADIGAGTGILTQQFAGRAGRLLAIEPNPAMQRMAATRLAGVPHCHLLSARAEATALRASSVDLITVATAASWFDPEAARREFTRIIKPGGWLAILRNYQTDNEKVGGALELIFPPQCDTDRWAPGRKVPIEFYFNGQTYRKLVFELPAIRQTWGDFLGALLTTSFAPDPDHAAYPSFQAAARDIFERYSQDGILHSRANTEVLIGQMEPGS